MSKSLAELQQEYTNLCVKAGNIQYQVSMLERELADINHQMRNINIDASKLKEKEEKDKDGQVENAPLAEVKLHE